MVKHWFTSFLTQKYSIGKSLGLDLGSGYRNWHEFFCCKYIAFDLPSKMKQEKQKRPDICGTATALPFKDDAFDFLTCYSVFPYVVNLDKCITEIHRVMKTTGIAVIIVQNPRGMSINKEEYFENPLNSKQLHVKLHAHGFRSVKHKSLKVYFYSTYYNLTSVYAYAIVQPIKNF